MKNVSPIALVLHCCKEATFSISRMYNSEIYVIFSLLEVFFATCFLIFTDVVRNPELGKDTVQI